MLTRRYITALVVVAVLTIGEFIAVDRLVRDQGSRGEILNRIAREQTLVQRAAALSEQLLLDPDASSRTTTRAVLLRVRDAIANLHSRDDGVSNRTAPAATTRLEQQMRDYVGALSALVVEPDSALTPDNQHVQYILAAAAGPTPALLEASVGQLTADQEAETRRIRTVAGVMLTATLVSLVLFAIFMFEPLVRRVHREAQLLEVANEELQNLSSLDGLTGVANRRAFDQRIEEELRRSHRDATPLAVLMIDIDHFKAFNDRYGHPRGDACLVELSTAVQSGLSRPADFFARYGGEEFTVILPDTDARGASVVGENLRRRVENLGLTHVASSVRDIVTISVGVAAASSNGQLSAADLVAAADRALYQAKQRGRNRVEITTGTTPPGDPTEPDQA